MRRSVLFVARTLILLAAQVLVDVDEGVLPAERIADVGIGLPVIVINLGAVFPDELEPVLVALLTVL